ncbi:bifunctional pyr operon transcriptional regulator/uracil phosphoribosyltransferase PyrR [Dissulfurirhabdus thermomarina]|uniref:Bifunctional protein PyrR n=2 Tax=Dissulfurirhabdus thermomarina TaxID=1765737 RepID=A0A6N9TRW1_DISTH|nr:bifunctional pyr operon transcriptional regulator/uracil phosphoribosyltransferase PyrR [Dissulfurirhabdus thermomarina]NMX24182.1 bifunctional pyr operon transcriptional regulator/uracil phosphoribosyltransferase PyrR [Dissulfurirhabdus thermomarina]
MAREIVDTHAELDGLALIGIRTGGVPLAERLRQRIAALTGTPVPTGILDITLYRDDWSRLSHHPIIRKTEIPFSIDDKDIVLVDDVLYTGRTIRAALDALSDLGRPRTIKLAVLVDRGWRELPIQADYVGTAVETQVDEHVDVFLQETHGRDAVVLQPEGA